MSPSELMTEGWSLMAFGMGFVFLFLSALVLITSLMSRVVGRFFPEPLPSAPAPRAAAPQPAQVDDELLAAISAAIKMHRNKA